MLSGLTGNQKTRWIIQLKTWMINGKGNIKRNDCDHWGGLCAMGGFLVIYVVIAGKLPRSRDFTLKASSML